MVVDVDTNKVLSISSMSVPVYDRFHAGRVNSGKITTFRGYFFLTPACADLFEPRGSGLKTAKIFV